MLASASISLRGVIDYGFCSAVLRPPDWFSASFRKAKGKADAAEMGKFGVIEAKIGIECLPLYQQQGELSNMSDGKAYVVVKVLRVDKIIPPEQRPVEQCDTFVQVQFDGMSFVTNTRADSLQPDYEGEAFYFELRLQGKL